MLLLCFYPPEEKIIFAVRQKYDVGGGTITFNDVIANIGDSMEASSGTFTTKIKGLYSFSFTAPATANDNSSGSEKVRITVKKNGETLFSTKNKRESFESNIAFSWMLQLDEEDTTSLSLSGGGLHACGNEWIQFTGQLLYAN